MSRFASKLLLAGCVLAGLVSVTASAQVGGQSTPPNLGANGWLNQGTFGGGGLLPAPGTRPEFLFHQDARYPFVPNGTGRQPTYRIADLDANPNVKQWAKDVMKKDNDEVVAGKMAKTARQSCEPAGMPGYDTYGFQPIHFLQEPKRVTMIFSGDQQVRHVYLDVPHSANVKPSWYGESVGHYEGDTLVIDTICLNTKGFVDNYRTPHTEKLHVVERWRIIEADSILEVRFTVDDPDTYNQPWTAIQRFRRVPTPMDEEVCAEGNFLLFDYGIPVANKPDF
jgi:hypothetical protein